MTFASVSTARPLQNGHIEGLATFSLSCDSYMYMLCFWNRQPLRVFHSLLPQHMLAACQADVCSRVNAWRAMGVLFDTLAAREAR